MDDKGRNAQCADRVGALLIVVDEPVDCGIDRQIDLGVVDRRDLRQDDGGAVRLHGGAVVELVDVLDENPHGDLLIRIVARHVDAHERDETHLRMLP